MSSLVTDIAAIKSSIATDVDARLDELDMAQWQAFVESHPHSVVFHHRRWVEMLRDFYRLDTYIPCLKMGDEVVAAAPFLECRSLRGARNLVSLPYSDYLPLLERRPRAANALLKALVRRHPPCDSMNMRTDSALADVPSASHFVRHKVQPLPPPEALISTFKTSVRRNLRIAERAGLRFGMRDDRGALDTFYHLHVLTRRRLGVPVQPKRFFERIHSELIAAGLGLIGVVQSAAGPVAAGVFLMFNGTMTFKYSASDATALTSKPNDLLVYSGMRLAAERGLEAFDFGVSNRTHEGLINFKRQWATDEADVHSVQLVGDGKTPNEESRLLKIGNVVIRHSPTFVCRWLGEFFYRFAN